MKKKLVLVHISLFIAFQVHSQSISVSRFMLMLDNEMAPTMGISNKAILALSLQQDNEEARDIMMNSFQIVQHLVDSATQYSINDINHLEGCARYSNMGIPISSTKKAAKSCDESIYAVLNIAIEAGATTTSETTVGSGDLSGTETKVKAKPIIIVTLKLADSSGKQTQKFVGKYKHDEAVSMSQQSLSIGKFDLPLEFESDVIPFYSFISKASAELVKQMTN